ncbi:MAG: SDR family NAD(P)-dependent oxidoreductase [Rhodospirillales bacterium]
MTDSLQVAVVVGAARGIGRAAAERLAARGIVIAAIDRLTDTLANTAANFAENGWHLDVHAADVTERDAVNGAIEKIIAAHGRIDILVNCAGITGVTGIKAHQVDPDDFDVVYQINLKAALLLSQAVLPSMLERNYGRILHVSSIAGKDGNAGMLAYSATKAGLIGLVKSAAKDYAESGITINALAPAVIQTDLVAAMPDHQVRYMIDKIPMKRTGTLAEAAAMIDWIVSPECSFTTGFTFDLSGGRAVF